MTYNLGAKKTKVGKSLQAENFQFVLPEKFSETVHIQKPLPKPVANIVREIDKPFLRKVYVKPRQKFPEVKKPVKPLNLNELLKQTLQNRERKSLVMLLRKDSRQNNLTQGHDAGEPNKLVKYRYSKKNMTYVIADLNSKRESKGRILTEETMNIDTPRERPYTMGCIFPDKYNCLAERNLDIDDIWNGNKVPLTPDEEKEIMNGYLSLNKDHQVKQNRHSSGKKLPARLKLVADGSIQPKAKPKLSDFEKIEMSQGMNTQETALRYKNKIKCTFPKETPHLPLADLYEESPFMIKPNGDGTRGSLITESKPQTKEEGSMSPNDKWKVFGSVYQGKKILLNFRNKAKKDDNRRLTWSNSIEDENNKFDNEDDLLSFRELIRNFKREKESYALIRKHLKERLFLIRKLGIPRDDIASLKVFSTEPFAKKKSIEFIRAAKKGDFISINYLVTENKYLVYDFDHFHLTALHWATRRNYYDIVALLIKNGADVDSRDIIGRTPLYFAVKGKFTELLQLLLYHKADPWSTKYYDLKPLLEEYYDGKTMIQKARKIGIAARFTLRNQKDIRWDSEGKINLLQPSKKNLVPVNNEN